MPLIDVKMYEGRLTPDNEGELIAALTEAVGRVLGEAAREQTWVVLQEVPPARWGIAGSPGA
jgi:4-oxalocrotonate tautomerase